MNIIENKDNFTEIKGNINSDKISLSEESLKSFLEPFLKLDFKNLKFSSENKIFIKKSFIFFNKIYTKSRYN